MISSLGQGNRNLYCPKLEMDLSEVTSALATLGLYTEQTDEATRSMLLFHGITSDKLSQSRTKDGIHERVPVDFERKPSLSSISMEKLQYGFVD